MRILILCDFFYLIQQSEFNLERGNEINSIQDSHLLKLQKLQQFNPKLLQ